MTTTTRTAAIFDTFAQRDDFLGWGYIGERDRAFEAVANGEWPASVIEWLSQADALALDMGATLTDDQLFTWANSKDGRWFADCAIGCGDLEMARCYGPKGGKR